MKTMPAIALAALAALAIASDPITIKPKFEKDGKTTLKTVFKVGVGGQTAEITGNVVVTTKSVDDKMVKLVYDWENPKAVLGGQETDIPFGPTDVTLTAAGELVEVSGGIQGSDPTRTLMLGFQHLPTAPIEKDGKWSVKYPASDKLGIGERSVEGTYLGEEEVAGKKAHKFKTVTKEGEFAVTMTYWVTTEGKPIKFSTEFTGLPVPAAGGSGDGSMTGEIVQ